MRVWHQRSGNRVRILRRRRSWFRVLLAPVAALAVITLGILGVRQVQRFLFTAQMFTVRQVLVSGNRQVPGAEIVRMMNLSAGINLFSVDLHKAGERIRRIRWIREVALHRQLPDTLRVNVQERSPFALVEAQSRFLVDREGIVLEEGVLRELYRLPVLAGVGGLRKTPEGKLEGERLLLGMSILGEIHRAKLVEEPFVVTLAPRGRVLLKVEGKPEIRLQPPAIMEQLNRLQSLPGIWREEPGREYIDLTFANMVVIK
ncbi:MAG: FtsQ-type POTRA domain-containing protein [Candidatus Tectomicrobia bacterium]|uniref:FtsQ-type POTRA domain-containing protein n=1 Tax=Tectimicrobiota bacterium TaxID=2528274 RepID=A0A932GP94_UNCTE|nr:FtsQ-type POTRA domain-containing protein [Candidatus Tectomicrobia bacterium]